MVVRLTNQPVVVERSHRMDSGRASEIARMEPMLRAEHRFSVDVHVCAGEARATLIGEIDLATRQELRSALCGLLGPGVHVTVDVGHVTLLDGGGVALALQLQQQARAHGGDLTFVNARGVVARVLAILDPERNLLEGEAS
jgi:anti-anti-sigma factor